jgi:2-dehydro-3-deoxyphosphogluconate aldolase/(4S)-4-hydroxy-2-oxoglutarate aldolase
LGVFVRSGFSNIEVTMNTPGATDMIRRAGETYGNDLNIGAGTVCTLDELHSAVDAGARFIVTPVLVKDVVISAVKMGIPVFPGSFSPTEIYEAWSAGASMVKIFPAAQLGPEYVKAVKAPFPQIKLMPTGGIGGADIPAYQRAGADAFGIGSPLFPGHLLKQKDWAGLSIHLKTFLKNRESGI